MERIGIENGPVEQSFQVNLQAGPRQGDTAKWSGWCELNPDVLSVRIAQHVLRSDSAELWNSASIFCERERSGALVVRVLVFNPDWDGGLQIAELRSWPADRSNLTPLGCNLNHIGP